MENVDKHLYLGLNKFVTSHVSKCGPCCRPFGSSHVTRCLETLRYKDFLQRLHLLYTDSQTPPSAHLRCPPPIVRPFLDLSGPSCPPEVKQMFPEDLEVLQNVAISNYPLQTALTPQRCSFAHFFPAIHTSAKEKLKSKIHRVT